MKKVITWSIIISFDTKWNYWAVP